MKHPDCFIGYLMFLVSLVERSSVSAFPPQNIPQERLTKSHNTINVYGIYLSTHQFLLRHSFVNGTGKPVSEVLSEFFGNGKQTWLSVILFFHICPDFKKMYTIKYKKNSIFNRKLKMWIFCSANFFLKCDIVWLLSLKTWFVKT